MTRHVIIGGDAAGLSAATQIRRLDSEADIIVFEKEDIISYAKCGLPYYIGGIIPEAEHLKALPPEVLREKFKVNLHTCSEVTAIHPWDKVITVRKNEKDEEHQYDKLLIATGARPRLPDWPGDKLKGVFPVNTMEDAVRISTWLEGKMAEKVVIIGGGYIGLEMAETLTHKGCKVTLLTKGAQLLNPFDPDMAKLAEEELKLQGVDVFVKEDVIELRGEGGCVKEVVTKTSSFPADMVIIAVGIIPNSELAIAAGIGTGLINAIEVNEKMETSVSGIYAAGDCATQYHMLKKTGDYIPLGTTANKQGNIAGYNMAGHEKLFPGVLGTAILKVFDLELARTGLNEDEARKLGLAFGCVVHRTKDHAGYYPDARKLYIKLLYSTDDHTLLGAQLVGYAGTKRIDTLATAITAGMTIEEVVDLDLAYAPPFSGVWDPVQQASRDILKSENRKKGM
ncbi:FAD-dependent oxidoreductase [Aneurinibacillus migulanus]|uniref:NADH dehydrogenase n=1 Tax=Aneurinibacillus migulanus TaxID=47500 RepID=A0A0D1V1A4_ANEMI|nr:FAD-dependent oxidoreductase [Aneurinibacillus migulanus]KIV53079.1 NADH dehydrogenase [Aneurinibacillus migulanus]KON90885.1 NADH dehydrogenase [Aneurinibacillus migulanus]MED0894072.1 FAD-dependent oxidoreductase [Aneurinibacillus migulanus]MED1616803.1 FAD-dependent oxidoreductase [Aneurinibacillus migulanus]SDJ92219.1 NADPH-dependent 2,4-dienoyl-CoA reductase, sulfur reductase [Aneurinibacillus migulanus]